MSIARWFAWRWSPRRRLHFTLEGWVFVAIAISLGLVAINTGHNLFYLIFALLLSVVIVSGVLSESVLKRIEVRREIPPEVTARVPFPVTVELRNLSSKRYCYSVTLSDGGPSARRDLGYLQLLGPVRTKTFHAMVQVDRRGRHRFEALHLATRFPFGLFEKVRIVPLESDIVAFPACREPAPFPPRSWAGEEGGARKSRWGEEILGLRPALPEDDYRSIHWRTSARAGSLVAKEFAQPAGQPRPVFFDHRGAPGQAFEDAVENAAGLIRFLAAGSIAATFFTWTDVFDLRAGAAEMKRALRHLALIAPLEGAGGEGYEKWRRMAAREGMGVVVRGAGIPPPSPPPACRVVFL